MKNAMEAISSDFPNGKPGAGNFVAGNVLSMVIRSRYGSKKPFNNTRDILAPKCFRTAPSTLFRFHFGTPGSSCSILVDHDRKRELEQKINEANMEKEMVESEISKISEEIKVAEGRIQGIKADKTAIEARRRAVYDAQRRLHTLQLKLGAISSCSITTRRLTGATDEKQRQLHDEQNAPSLEEKRAELRRKGLDFARQRLAIVRRLKVRFTPKPHHKSDDTLVRRTSPKLPWEIARLPRWPLCDSCRFKLILTRWRS